MTAFRALIQRVFPVRYNRQIRNTPLPKEKKQPMPPGSRWSLGGSSEKLDPAYLID